MADTSCGHVCRLWKSQRRGSRLVKNRDCGAVLTRQSGAFASPNWPRNYEHNLNCTWHVRVPKYKVISFDFIHFDLGPRSSNPCDPANDRLVISEMASHGPVRFCATSPMTPYISHSNDVTFQFVSTNSVDAPGFHIFYSGDWPCNAVLTEDNGQLASPSWPLQYPALLDCTWTIQAPPTARVALHFSAIDLDGQGFGRCTDHYDVIKVYDGDSPDEAQLLGRLCGHDPVTSYTSSHSVLLVKFKTDAHVQRTGFHATYSFLYLSTTTALPTTSSISSSSSTTTTTAPPHDVYKVTSLTAQFVEPAHDVKHDWAFSSPLPGNRSTRLPYPGETGEGKASEGEEMGTALTMLARETGEDGGVYAGPDVSVVNGRGSGETRVSETFVRTMWAVVTSLVFMLLLLLIVLVLVCRHYRKKVPKRRNVPNYTFTEEDLSLYEKDTLTSVSCQNVESAAYKFHTDPDPEIAFSNPLYESRFPPLSQAASRRTSMTTMTSFSRC